ncbi:hypothetical protein TWF696_005276 [Orbilia brochopaga]|uniref:Uncharacterized protein n=1 Tax=Orbilia brochopaga TaxID=3140254 RepID=A0AAV9V3H9_9PEZI
MAYNHQENAFEDSILTDAPPSPFFKEQPTNSYLGNQTGDPNYGQGSFFDPQPVESAPDPPFLDYPFVVQSNPPQSNFSFVQDPPQPNVSFAPNPVNSDSTPMEGVSYSNPSATDAPARPASSRIEKRPRPQKNPFINRTRLPTLVPILYSVAESCGTEIPDDLSFSFPNFAANGEQCQPSNPFLLNPQINSFCAHSIPQPYFPNVEHQSFVPSSEVQLSIPPPQSFILESQPFIPESQPFVSVPQPFIPEHQPLIAAPQSFILESQAFVPESQVFIPESQGFISESQSFIPESQSFIPHPEPNPEPISFIPDQTSTFTPDIQHPVGITSDHGSDAQVDLDEDNVSTPRAPVQMSASPCPQPNVFPPPPTVCSDFPDSSPFAQNTREDFVRKCEQLAISASKNVPGPGARLTASSAPNHKPSCDDATKTASPPEPDLPVHTAQAPDYSVFERLACSATCELCHNPPKLLEVVAKENRRTERITKPKHKLGFSLLSKWMLNIFNGATPPQVNHEIHYTWTVNLWIKRQKERTTVKELWVWITGETRVTDRDCDTARWWPMSNSFAAWSTFMEQLQLAAPPEIEFKHRSLDNTLILRASRFLLVAIRLLETQEPEFLKKYKSLEFYVDMLVTAASYVISLFGYHDWITDGIWPSRLKGKPIWTWFRLFGKDLQTCQSTQKERISNFKQAWPWIHSRTLKKSGRYMDNRPYYIPTMIVDEKGDVVMNVGHIYITSISSHEEWCIEQYELAKAYYRKHPERRPKIARNLIMETDPEEEKREAFLMGYCNWYRRTQKMPKKGSVFTVIPMREPTPEDPWYEYCKIEEPEPLGEEPKPRDPYHDPTNDRVDPKLYFM